MKTAKDIMMEEKARAEKTRLERGKEARTEALRAAGEALRCVISLAVMVAAAALIWVCTGVA